MEIKHYIKLLEESILRKIESVPRYMFVYNDKCGWNECGVDCLFSYEHKQLNDGIIVLYTDFNRIVDVDGKRFIYSDRYGRLFDMHKKFGEGKKIYGRNVFATYEYLLECVDKSLCSYDEHMSFVASEKEKVVCKYGEYIRNGIYFTDAAVSKDCVFKIASDIKYKFREYRLVFYVDVERYDIDYKNTSLVKREKPYYDELCVENIGTIKDSIIKDVKSFIEGVRDMKIKEIDERIKKLMGQKEQLIPITIDKTI